MSDSDHIVVHRRDINDTIDSMDTADFYLGNIGQGPAKLASQEDLDRDALGFTHPNLHRRVDPKAPEIADCELNQEQLKRSYGLTIQNVTSYQTTHINTHDEDSTSVEIP